MKIPKWLTKTTYIIAVITCFLVLFTQITLCPFVLDLNREVTILVLSLLILLILPFMFTQIIKLKIGSIELFTSSKAFKSLERISLIKEVVNYRNTKYYIELSPQEELIMRKIEDHYAIDFLKSHKGIINLSKRQFKKMRKGNDFPKTSNWELVTRDGKHKFFKIENRLFYIGNMIHAIRINAKPDREMTPDEEKLETSN